MSGARVLIIEDDHDIREMLESVLKDEGYEVWSAKNGRAGLEVLRSQGLPSLILLDLMMPVMDGKAFLEEAAKDPKLAAVPVLLLTASHTGTDLPVSGYLKKPLDLDQLLDSVGRFVKGAPG